MKWEYFSWGNATDAQLNAFGLEGWELVSVVLQRDDYLYFFKRPIPTKHFNTEPR